jgi:hypothetical protein
MRNTDKTRKRMRNRVERMRNRVEIPIKPRKGMKGIKTPVRKMLYYPKGCLRRAIN